MEWEAGEKKERKITLAQSLWFTLPAWAPGFQVYTPSCHPPHHHGLALLELASLTGVLACGSLEGEESRRPYQGRKEGRGNPAPGLWKSRVLPGNTGMCWLICHQSTLQFVKKTPGLPGGTVVKTLPANAGHTGDMVLTPWNTKWQPTPIFLRGKCHGLLRGAWQATVHGVAKSGIRLSNYACVRTHAHTHTHTHTHTHRVVPTFWGKRGSFFFINSNVHGVSLDSYLYLKWHITERKGYNKFSNTSRRNCILFITTTSYKPHLLKHGSLY